MKHISRVEEAYPGWMIRSWQKQRAEANKDKEPRVMKDRDLTDTVIKFKKEIIQGQPNYYYKTSEGPKANKVTMSYLANKANAHLGIDTSNPRGNYSYLTLNQQEYDTLSKAIEANGGKVSLIESAETRIKTPRGLIRVSDKSESELNKEGYGYWFSAEVDGVSYRVLNNGTYAVAVKGEIKESVDNDILPKRVGNAILVVNTYADYEKEGFTKEDVDDWFGTNGNLKATYSYETADDESGSMIGVETTDGKYAIYGARQDEEDITFEHMAEVLVSEASSLGDINESFSKTAYDANTLAMLELKVPEEVLKQKEELNTCKEFKDERVKSQPIKKVKDIKAMKLDDNSVTDAQKVNDGKVSELKSKK